MPIPIFQFLGRAFAVPFFSLFALAHLGLSIPFVRRNKRRQARTFWLHRWSRFACRVLGLRLTTLGVMPKSGLLVCNHLSYLDIIALAALGPCVFVAKRDVAGWPIFGWLARAAGTIFVDRHRRTVTAQTVHEISAAIDEGLLVVLFPEGTSSDGATVRPFKSPLLQPAIDLQCPVALAAFRYSLAHGSVADEVCYWREMTLLPHLLNLFRKPDIGATLAVTRYDGELRDRKECARNLRSQVLDLLRLTGATVLDEETQVAHDRIDLF